ncbi:hypothetical protein [Streptomyces canus]|uniref:hypothetical protein n=1 Tax=Streptomyces canus TaxID=58343 RepID=UPI0036EB6984
MTTAIGALLLVGIVYNAGRLLVLRGRRIPGRDRGRNRPTAWAVDETTSVAEAEEGALARRLLAGQIDPVSYRRLMDTLAHRTPQPHGGPHG